MMVRSTLARRVAALVILVATMIAPAHSSAGTSLPLEPLPSEPLALETLPLETLPLEPLASAADYLAMWNRAILPAVTAVEPAGAGWPDVITGDPELDARIVEQAEARGYRRQSVPVGALVDVGSWQLQPAAALAWEELRAAAARDDTSLMIVSAHRSPELQRSLFVGRLAGRTSEAGIDAALASAAPPGYSKHHSGYAIDIAQPGRRRGGFVTTPAYEWLAADDFANARVHGWIPSYPADGVNMGPEPEPWEFVWVGVGGQQCTLAGETHDGFCDVAASPHADAVGWLQAAGVVVGCGGGQFCIDSPITRGEAASVLWRAYGSPLPLVSHPFSDVSAEHHFGRAVAWMVEGGITTGTTSTTFSPHRPLSPVELSTWLESLDRAGTQSVLASAGRSSFPSLVEQIKTVELIERGEFASILRAWLVPDHSASNVNYMITRLQKREDSARHKNTTHQMDRD